MHPEASVTATRVSTTIPTTRVGTGCTTLTSSATLLMISTSVWRRPEWDLSSSPVNHTSRGILRRKYYDIFEMRYISHQAPVSLPTKMLQHNNIFISMYTLKTHNMNIHLYE